MSEEIELSEFNGTKKDLVKLTKYFADEDLTGRELGKVAGCDRSHAIRTKNEIEHGDVDFEKLLNETSPEIIETIKHRLQQRGHQVATTRQAAEGEMPTEEETEVEASLSPEDQPRDNPLSSPSRKQCTKWGDSLRDGLSHADAAVALANLLNKMAESSDNDCVPADVVADTTAKIEHFITESKTAVQEVEESMSPHQ